MTVWKLHKQGLKGVFLGSLAFSLTEQSYKGEYSFCCTGVEREGGLLFLRLSLP